ncbi:MAG: hypothetical protein ACD_20C00308G0001 [uncultured bacterium]|nr:MAG: hypothetical protein ACD_20C00308G0001 [uncultured bacterium]
MVKLPVPVILPEKVPEALVKSIAPVKLTFPVPASDLIELFAAIFRVPLSVTFEFAIELFNVRVALLLITVFPV